MFLLSVAHRSHPLNKTALCLYWRFLADFKTIFFPRRCPQTSPLRILIQLFFFCFLLYLIYRALHSSPTSVYFEILPTKSYDCSDFLHYYVFAVVAFVLHKLPESIPDVCSKCDIYMFMNRFKS